MSIIDDDGLWPSLLWSLLWPLLLLLLGVHGSVWCGSDHGEERRECGLCGHVAAEKRAHGAHFLKCEVYRARFVRGGEILLGLDESSACAGDVSEKLLFRGRSESGNRGCNERAGP